MAASWFGPRLRMALAGCSIVALATGLWAWRRYALPPPLGRQSEATSSSEQQALEQVAASRATTATIPGLGKGVPCLVPGLEDVEIPYGASLADDLCTIVFPQRLTPNAGFILHIATRANVSSPFGPPQVIRLCASSRSNYKPALSRDGLELIYLQNHDNPRLLHTRRRSQSDSFEEPVPWPVPEIAQTGNPLFMVRFLDPLRVLLCTNRPGNRRFWFFICQRANSMSAFGPPKEIVLGKGADGRLFLRPDLLLSYVGRDDGLFMRVRNSEQEPLGEEVCVANRAKCGPVVGPVWVGASADVVFYSSVGPEGDAEGPRYLWMVRL
jgi:hypothetical protein